MATLLPTETLDGWSITPLTWTHPDSDGDHVFGAVYRPDPLPGGPLPLLINVHGHWGAGIEADEVNRRAILFAQQGWLVISVANRGDEHGVDTPTWRRSHHVPAGYALARIRRGGGAPLAWDVAAARAGLDLALTGRLGAPVDRERIATMGFSGGAERAAVLAATDPRIAAVVLGAYEYAFSSGHGSAGCTCGAVRGAAEPLQDHPHAGRPMPDAAAGYLQPVQGWRWLALAGCRPGAPVRSRPVLLWDNFPGDVVDLELAGLPGVARRSAEGVHGVTPAMAAASWAWLDGAVGRAGGDAERARARAEAGYSVIHPRWRPPFPEGLPAPGNKEQGPPPWRANPGVRPDAILAMLGLNDGGDPAAALGIEAAAALQVHPPLRASAPAARTNAWLVVTAGAPGPIPAGLDEQSAIPWIGGPAQLAALGGLEQVRSAAPAAVVAHLELRVGRTAEGDSAASAWGGELGLPALGAAVQDVLAAHGQLRAHPGVAPDRIGLLGLGPAGVAVLLGAILVGEGGPVALAQAPVTLWFDGPTAGPPFIPWPSWTLGPIPGGASLDPWPAAAALGDRVRWFDPRGGDGQPWVDHLPHGVVVSTLDALLVEGR